MNALEKIKKIKLNSDLRREYDVYFIVHFYCDNKMAMDVDKSLDELIAQISTNPDEAFVSYWGYHGNSEDVDCYDVSIYFYVRGNLDQAKQKEWLDHLLYELQIWHNEKSGEFAIKTVEIIPFWEPKLVKQHRERGDDGRFIPVEYEKYIVSEFVFEKNGIVMFRSLFEKLQSENDYPDEDEGYYEYELKEENSNQIHAKIILNIRNDLNMKLKMDILKCARSDIDDFKDELTQYCDVESI